MISGEFLACYLLQFLFLLSEPLYWLVTVTKLSSASMMGFFINHLIILFKYYYGCLWWFDNRSWFLISYSIILIYFFLAYSESEESEDFTDDSIGCLCVVQWQGCTSLKPSWKNQCELLDVWFCLHFSITESIKSSIIQLFLLLFRFPSAATSQT